MDDRGAPPQIDGVVFAHDNTFLRSSDDTYYSFRGTWPWDRYLRFARYVTVVSRQSPLPAGSPLQNLELSSRSGVSFVEVESLANPIARIASRRLARKKIAWVLRNHDAVVARLPSEIGAVAIQAAEEMGKPYAIELVTCTWDALWNHGSWQAKAYAPVSWFETRRLVKRAPAVFYVTNGFLQRRYPTNGIQVGVSDVEIDELSDDTLAQRISRIESRPEPFVLGLIGYLDVRFKGVHLALKALQQAREQLPDVIFRVLGPGDPAEMRALAERLGIGDIVYFDGTLPAGRVAEWLDQIDLYLQPSLQEGLPRSLIEAMARACPALGSTAGGIPELLDESCLHAPGDVGALTKDLIRAINDHEWLARSARRNFEAAHRFRRAVLEPLRDEFWSTFASSVAAGRSQPATSS